MIDWLCKGVTEASSLGLAAGEWPMELTVTVLGANVTLFRGPAIRHGNGSFAGYEYSARPQGSTSSFVLNVFND